jgi:hypothetical protein
MGIEDTRIPKGGVVVIGSLSGATQERLAKAAEGKIERISEAPLTQVVEKTGVNLRKLSERINEVVGSEGIVAPLFSDAEGNRLLPTGRVQVRFKQPLTDHSLTDFAKRHNVELAQRNKWSPQQVEFAMRTDDTRYFPDVASELKKDDAVMTAWPDVLAAFRRA